jgi:adenylate kinase family enzyme
MVQVTITGQLSILMVIEALELAGIPVISANTDGIVIACPAHRYDDMVAIFTAWEQHTGLETEETEYKALYAANVNNYIAVKMDGKTKTKGWYCERGSAHNSVLSKNPEALICSDAVQKYLSKGVPIEKTIRECKDVRRFVVVRAVAGGGVKVWGDDHTEYLGKKIRWYYGKDVPGEIVYAKSGNKVARSDGAKPMMQLTAGIPEDIDFEWYEAKAAKILVEIGASV